MIATRFTALVLTGLCLTSTVRAQTDAAVTPQVESTDPTVASPLIRQLLQNLLQLPADGTRTTSTTAAPRGPRFRLSGLVLTSPTAGTAVITTQTGTIRLTLKKSGAPTMAPLSAEQFGSKPTDTAPDATAPRTPPPRIPGDPPQSRAVTNIDLSSSFSDGDSLFRVIDFRRGMILLEELPQGRLVIVR